MTGLFMQADTLRCLCLSEKSRLEKKKKKTEISERAVY